MKRTFVLIPLQTLLSSRGVFLIISDGLGDSKLRAAFVFVLSLLQQLVAPWSFVITCFGTCSPLHVISLSCYSGWSLIEKVDQPVTVTAIGIL